MRGIRGPNEVGGVLIVTVNLFGLYNWRENKDAPVLLLKASAEALNLCLAEEKI